MWVFWSCALLGWAGLAQSVPAVLTARDVSSSLLARLDLASQYAAAAYCLANTDSPGDKVACVSGNCPQVEAADTTTSIEFQNSAQTDVTGFVAVDSTNEEVVVAFRGSSSVRNWLTNVNAEDIESDLCDGCTVHQGFWRSWLEARSGIITALEEAADENPGFEVVATGHSLGGALATLAAADLRNDGYPVTLYSFGAPMVGNARTAEFISSQPGRNFRVTHQNDAVPKLPGSTFGYSHFDPEYFISSPNDEVVNTDDITVVTGRGGNLGTFGFSLDAHGFYFVDIGACAPEGFEFKV